MSSVNTVEEAVGLLVQGADIGIKSGIFNIKEAKYLVDAIEFLIPNYFNEVKPEPVGVLNEQTIESSPTIPEIPIISDSPTIAEKKKEYKIV